ncbi:MAG: metallophosphatase [Flavobacteriaceae bacterium]|jgi:5'-nucleotidase|nr:metallophosphatase [Flavobacteriaceae bacterium]
MKRRRFIKNSIYGSLGGSLILNSLSCEKKNFKKITILHTNDVHSHIEPFPKDHSKFPNMGGFERRSTLINNIRLKNPNTLLLDAGDVFQGTPYFNFYGGELEFKLMSMLKYDAMTIGNHDFDNGIDGLNSQLPKASFDIISSNYDFSNTILENKIKRTKTYILDEVKIGVFGLGIELKGLVSDELYKETKYLDPVEISNDITDYLKNEEKCDLIICLSHLGFKYKKNKISDFILAQKTKDIDLIIGGHTHTFMDKPTITKNKIGNDVIINQVGCFGVYLGKIDFYLDTNKIKIAKSKLLTI